MGCVKRNIAFEHAQNVQICIILRMRKVSSDQRLSIETCLVSKDSVYEQRMSWSDWEIAQVNLGVRCPHMPGHVFAWHGPNVSEGE